MYDACISVICLCVMTSQKVYFYQCVKVPEMLWVCLAGDPQVRGPDVAVSATCPLEADPPSRPQDAEHPHGQET